MRRTPRHLISFAFICAVLAAHSLMAAPSNPKLDKLRSQYDGARARYAQEYQVNLENLRKWYLTALDNLMRELTRAGDLDGALAIRAEKQKIAEADALESRAPDPVPPRSPPQNTVRRSAVADLESSLSREKTTADAEERRLQMALDPQMKKHRGAKGEIKYIFSNELPHTLKDFPTSRQFRINRAGDIPAFPLEPRQGKILSPEFRTKEATLRVAVDGAALVFQQQGFRGNTGQVEAYLQQLEKDGWILVQQSWEESKPNADHQFMMVKVASDEVLEFEGRGAWKSLPTLIFGPLERGSLTVKEMR